MKSCGICARQWLHEEIAMPAISKNARVCETCGSPIETTSAVRKTLEQLCINHPDNFVFPALLSEARAVMREKDSALRVAERAIMLLARVKDRVNGPTLEQNLALIQTMFGQKGRGRLDSHAAARNAI